MAGDLDAHEEEDADPGKATILWFEPGPDGDWHNPANRLVQGDIKYAQRVEQMARDIFSCLPHGVVVESSFSIRRFLPPEHRGRLLQSDNGHLAPGPL